MVTDDNGALVACAFSKSKKRPTRSVIESLPSAMKRNLVSSPEDSGLADVLHQIYTGQKVSQLPRVLLQTHSSFLTGVYETAMRIPKGMVTTYGKLAQRAGSKTLSRAVGNAMAKNPLPLVVPCHRVVPSTLRVGNYGGAGASRREGSRIKHDLLLREGVQFDGNRVSKRCVWDPS